MDSQEKNVFSCKNLGQADTEVSLNHIALRKAKIAYNFGLSECKRVRVNGYTFRGITLPF